MTNRTVRLSLVGFCASALAALIPLSSAGAAPAERHHGGGMAAHATMRGAPAFRGGHRVAMAGSHVFRGRSAFVGRRFAFHHGSRFGYRYSYGYGGAVGYGYPYYSGGYYAYGYGYPRHSCWWYYHFDPADTPSWCGSYGYSYGYAAPAYGYGYAYGGYGGYGGYGYSRFGFHRHFAVRSGAGFNRNVAVRSGAGFNRNVAFRSGTRVEGRAASVSGPSGRLNSGAHFGGAAHMGGQAGRRIH